MTSLLLYGEEAGPLIYLFPGQGSQRVGMGREVVDAYPTARAVFAEADQQLGFALSKLCFEGPEDLLNDTVNAQPALFATCLASLCALQEEMGALPRPVLFAGHSMGEYTALAAAGCVTFADGLQLVRERGRLMKEAGARQPGRMAAIIGLREEIVAEVCAEAAAEEGVAQIANDNCPGQVVISGDKESMVAAMAALEKRGARKVVPLAVSIAAHSPLMGPAAAQLEATIEATDVRAPIAPLIGNTSAQPLDNAAAIRQELNAQLTGSVQWTASMNYAVGAGVNTAVEVGPGTVLTGLMKRIQRRGNRVNIAGAADVRAFAERFSQ